VKQEKLEAFETKNFAPRELDNLTLGLNGNPAVVDGPLTNVTGTPYIYASDEEKTIKYAAIPDIGELETNWTLTASVRYEHYSDFASTINSRAALVWTTTDFLIAKLLYEEVFRAPSFLNSSHKIILSY